MIHRLALVLAAFAAAAPLAAQDVPPPERLLVLRRGADGVVVALDTALAVRERAGRFWVDQVVRFPAPVAAQGGRTADWRRDALVVDCGSQRLRHVASSLYSGPAWAGDVDTDTTWTAPADTAEFRVTCDALRPFDDPRYESSHVEEQPSLANAGAVRRLLKDAYPPAPRRAGVGGMAQVRMRILSAGTVDPATVEVIRSSAPDFAAAAVRVATALRFEPARVRGHPTPVWVVLPITFNP